MMRPEARNTTRSRMRTIRRSRSLMDRLPDPVREFLSRRAAELVGLGLLAPMVVVALAPASWSAEEPSLNNATNGAVRNWLGRPGAMIADLLMQLVGLGVIALLFPPMIWALRLIRFHLFDRGALKLGLWVIGITAAAAVASALPPTPRWPLPTGMGGVIGDGLLFGTRNIAGIAGSAVASLVGFLYAGIAILAVTAAAGFGFVHDEDPVLDDEADDGLSDGEERGDADDSDERRRRRGSGDRQTSGGQRRGAPGEPGRAGGREDDTDPPTPDGRGGGGDGRRPHADRDESRPPRERDDPGAQSGSRGGRGVGGRAHAVTDRAPRSAPRPTPSSTIALPRCRKWSGTLSARMFADVPTRKKPTTPSSR